MTDEDHGEHMASSSQTTGSTLHQKIDEAAAAVPGKLDELVKVDGHQPSASAASTASNASSALMPPPAAPASLLHSIRASNTAPPPGQRHRDPFICSRLIAVVVTLFRQGKGKEAKALAQFTVDLIEDELWDKYLQMYMSTGMESVDVTFVFELLEEAREEMVKVDPMRAGFLAVLQELIRNKT